MPRLRGLPKTGGRPKRSLNKATKAVKEIAGQFTDAAVMTLATIMTDPTAPHAARVAAAAQLLDRGHGRPHQTRDIAVTETQHYVRAPAKLESEEWAELLKRRQAPTVEHRSPNRSRSKPSQTVTGNHYRTDI